MIEETGLRGEKNKNAGLIIGTITPTRSRKEEECGFLSLFFFSIQTKKCTTYHEPAKKNRSYGTQWILPVFATPTVTKIGSGKARRTVAAGGRGPCTVLLCVPKEMELSLFFFSVGSDLGEGISRNTIPSLPIRCSAVRS